jgi:radical SAM protein with 4Fe4S-binding SPASM domain
MVTETIATAGRQALRSLRHDLTGFFGLTGEPLAPERGLHTYRYHSDGGQSRIHLRIDDNGRGVLFVDVTDVIHLNETAASLAKLALDGIPMRQARQRYLSHVRPSERRRLRQDIQVIYHMIDGLRNPAGECPTCALTELENAPLFSVPTTAPYKADLALTYGCNNACGHCYNEPERFSMPSLTTNEWRLVLDKLHKLGVPHIIFTGGEATLHPDLPDLVRYADSLGMVTGLNTNGRRIANTSYMGDLASAGLNHIQVTLGSNRPDVHDAIMSARSFHQTVRGIKNVLSSGVHCITNTTLMRCNKDHVDEIVYFLHDIGLRTFAMNGMIYSGGGLSDPNAIPEAEMPPILIRVRDLAADLGMRFLWYTPTEYCRMSPVELELGAKRCNAAEYSICIEPNGDVLPCQSYYAGAGNILDDPWSSLWQGSLFRSFRNRGVDPRGAGLPEKCWSCPDLALCGGGCRLEREARSDQPSFDHVVALPSGCAGSYAEDGRSQEREYEGFRPAPRSGNGSTRARGGQLGLVDIADIKTHGVN